MVQSSFKATNAAGKRPHGKRCFP